LGCICSVYFAIAHDFEDLLLAKAVIQY
jgi:hypothetical protein